MYNNYGYYSYNDPYYYDNSYANLPYYDDRLPVQTLVPVATIQSHLNAGRQGHCFRSFWGNTQHHLYFNGHK